MGFAKEFREFIMRGNVIDLAVGVIIGGAFNAIVTSLIQDVITPILLNPLLEAANVTTLQAYVWHGAKLGMFVSSVITFLLTALVLFVIIKAINAARKKQETALAVPPEPSSTDKLLMEIRDSLKK